MPSIEENRATWDTEPIWHDDGDDWSESWGGVEAQWYGSVLPRVRPFLPAGTVLEIAPGHGRWTQFLVEQSDRLLGVDLSAGCVEACRRRFADVPHASFHQNDGRSLHAVEDGSVDFAFSFDSLVHVESDVLDDYLAALTDKLAPAGVAFLHHSNLAEHVRRFDAYDRIPAKLRARLEQLGLADRSHWRARSVSAAGVAATCERVGLRCVGQEIINWGSRQLIDCMTIAVLPSHPQASAPPRVVRNPDFMAAAASIRAASEIWPRRSAD